MLALVVAAALAGVPAGAPVRARPALELLRGGSGVSTVLSQPLDVTFASEMTGSWFSLRGDGTTAGPLALSAVGSPSSQTDRVCPNGPDCGAVTSRRIDGSTSYFTTQAINETGKSISGCVVFSVDDATANTLMTWSAPTVGTLVRQEPTGAISVYFENAAAVGAAAGSIIPGAWHFLCWTYRFVGAGAVNRAEIFVDGVSKGASSTVSAMSSVSAAWDVGRRAGAPTEAFNGRIAAAFLTEKELSSATVAAMSTAVLPSLQGSRGEAVTTTRSTVRTCCNSAGCALLPANRTCVQSGAIDVTATRTNLLTQSQGIDLAAWTKEGGSAADGFLAPDGTFSADRFTDSAGAGAHRVYNVAVATSAAAYADQFCVKAGTLSWVRFTNNGATGNRTLTINAATGSFGTIGAGTTNAMLVPRANGWYCPSWSWVYPNTPSEGMVINFGPTEADVLAGTYTATGTGTFFLWGGQIETGTVATSYCPTTTASAVCNGDQTTTLVTADWPVATGSVAVTYVSPTGQFPNDNWIRSIGAGTNGWKFVGAGNTVGFSCFTNGTPTGPSALGLSFSPGQRYRLAASWTAGGTATVYRDGVPLATAACGAISNGAAVGAAANLFDNGLATTLRDAQFSDLCVSNSVDGCRR